MSKTRNVKELMNPDVMTVADEMTTDELARYLIGSGIIVFLGRAWITIFPTFPGWAMWRFWSDTLAPLSPSAVRCRSLNTLGRQFDSRRHATGINTCG
jgi:hypothetical protein